ncbi:AGE family epimerase/isomerase [soil metagenome]
MSQNPGTDVLKAYHKKFHRELYDNVLPFWLENSLDEKHGGYFNCLDRKGSVYDTTKHVWLQGRQVWMLSKIHNVGHKPGKDSKYLRAATLGANFLREFARTPEDRVYFSLTRQGRPHFMQRKMFSECFYVMALAEYARAAKDKDAKKEARALFEKVKEYAKDSTLVGRPSYKGATNTITLAVPMILLNLIEELNDPGEDGYADLAKWCVGEIDKHVRPELGLVLETVSPDGKLIDSPEGRLVNPGHAIEAGWFLMQYAIKTNDERLKEQALQMIEWSYDFGRDREHGGIFYFLDSEGHSPVQLEWPMKLWWVHCESMVAFIMAYQLTGDAAWFKKFEDVTAYCFDRFKDPRFPEWFGYLDRRGDVSQNFKGGPYKGCFHVPRSLHLVEKTLAQLISGNTATQGDA